MDPEGALRHAILDAPADDEPRLIYADWLEDHDDSVRADFIRVQCQLARLPRDDPGRKKMEDREDELLDEETELAWIERWPNWRGVEWAALRLYERGFPVVTFENFETFRKRIESVWEVEPVTAVRFMTLNAETARRLARSHLARLSWLDLGAGPTAVRDEGAAALVSSPHVRSLLYLNLRDNELHGEALRALAAAPGLGRLERLRLCRNWLRDDDAEPLLASPHLGNLFWLDLADNHLTAEFARALASSPRLPRLARLDLTGNRIDRHEATQLRREFGDKVRL
jgi:uncharacterized protein (TIGR02996 family)